VGADVHPERGLSHRRPCGENDQVLALKSRGELVDAYKAGVETGESRAGLARGLDVGELGVGQPADRHETAGEGVLGDPVDILLGRLHRLAGLAVVKRAGREDPLCGRHELALDRLVVDDLRVVDHVGHIGQCIDQ